MIAARLDVEADPVPELVAVGRIVNRPMDGDVDTTDGVDGTLEAKQVDRGEVVDLDTQQATDGGLQGPHPAHWIISRVRVGDRHQRVELGVVRLPVRQGHAVQVARNRDHR